MPAPTLNIDGRVATITLDRPEASNRLSPDDLRILSDLVREVSARDEILVLMLRGEGRHFCSGYDIGSLGRSTGGPAAVDFEEMVNVVEDCRPVTIARLHGGVYGGATDLALACDFRIGTPACDMFMPAARLGLHYYRRGMERYVSRLGLDTAKRLFLTAERLDGQAMRDCGFLTELVPAERLDARCHELAETLSAMAPIPLLGMKKHLNRIARGHLDVDDLRRDQALASASEDLQEGARSFREKRKPVFRGR